MAPAVDPLLLLVLLLPLPPEVAVGVTDGAAVGAWDGFRLIVGAEVGAAVGERLTAVADAPVTPYDAWTKGGVCGGG
jgi:hypothetical protein